MKIDNWSDVPEEVTGNHLMLMGFDIIDTIVIMRVHAPRLLKEMEGAYERERM